MNGEQAPAADIGIIGGSGLYALEELEDVRELRVGTPFGDPSDALVLGTLAGRSVAFLPRHGATHRLPPTRIPARANIYALKHLGVRQVISVSAVGSLREELAPGDLVTPDQIVDRTRGERPSTFFDEGVAVHVSLADPYCDRLRGLLTDAARRATTATVHDGATYCCMEGPQFSSRAESSLYRSWGMDIIGMTALPEAKLAREAELCYAGLTLVTDYDCWHVADVSADTVAEVMARNGAAAQATLVELAGALDTDAECACRRALTDAIITPPDAIPSVVRDTHSLFLDRHLPARSPTPAARPVTETGPV